MEHIKQKFIKVASFLWSHPDNAGITDATEIEAMLEAWLVNQNVYAKTASEREYINSILDNEKFSDFNEKCNHINVRLSQIETYFEEVYEAEEEESQLEYEDYEDR